MNNLIKLPKLEEFKDIIMDTAKTNPLLVGSFLALTYVGTYAIDKAFSSDKTIELSYKNLNISICPSKLTEAYQSC